MCVCAISYMLYFIYNIYYHIYADVLSNKYTWQSAVASAAEVVKKKGELYMTCKAYNGRVVTEWLADALRRCYPTANDPRMACAYACVILGIVNLHACTVWFFPTH